ncbi:unnamed protein product [Cuscuta campestris]|uniref:Sec-independent protein translocase protein TATA, chloroplastic n=1 Tax=Cuscuta campestris TaxID=132261 RepID=A0A484MCE6_9ASTE|nr:unnamed protein product [Cuscuta campestris]
MAATASAASAVSLSCKPIRTSAPTELSSSGSLFFSGNKTGLKRSFGLRAAKISSNGRKGLSCNSLFGLGVPELVVIGGVAALLFGPKQLPEIGRSIGKTIKGFQQAAKEFETELKKEPDSPPDPHAEVEEHGQENSKET